jgi:hypothetical protein
MWVLAVAVVAVAVAVAVAMRADRGNERFEREREHKRAHTREREPSLPFYPSPRYVGSRPGYYFGTNADGLGYHTDTGSIGNQV